MEQFPARSLPWGSRQPDEARAEGERVEGASGFADYDVETLETYLRQRNAAFGYPLRAWNGRWIAAGGRSFTDFADALDETRSWLRSNSDQGYNDTILGVFGFGYRPEDNMRHGLPSPSGSRWQILDGRTFFAYGDAEYETFRLCPDLFERGLSRHERTRRVGRFLAGRPEYWAFLKTLIERLEQAGGGVSDIAAFGRRSFAAPVPASWLLHAPFELERRGVGTVIDRDGEAVGLRLHEPRARQRLEVPAFDQPVLPPTRPLPLPLPSRPHWLRPRLVLKGLLALFAALFLWLSLTAPLSQSLRPVAAPSITVLASDGRPIARRGVNTAEPVSVAELPPHVAGAFLAIEDRRFYSHIGVDPWGIARAALRNLFAGRVREGGSTISQQLAKTSFLNSDRTMGRKAREVLIALWLETWLSKEEILSRYLSNVYFGDNVYGLRAAARHYFNTRPEDLTVPQAAMLAAIVNAPSRLSPTRNLRGAQQRSRLVMRAMAEEELITRSRLARLRPAVARRRPASTIPTGTYFADWVLPAVPEGDEPSYTGRTVGTTLDRRLQRIAIQALREARIGRAEAALVAMRRDGSVVAMLGGRDYRRSPFNRATQARRQPGSTFKLFVYLAALRSGMRPDDLVEDRPFEQRRLAAPQPWRDLSRRYHAVGGLRPIEQRRRGPPRPAGRHAQRHPRRAGPRGHRTVEQRSEPCAGHGGSQPARDDRRLCRRRQRRISCGAARPASGEGRGIHGCPGRATTAGPAGGRFATCATFCSSPPIRAPDAPRRCGHPRSARPGPPRIIATLCSSALPAISSSESGSAMTTTGRCRASPAAARPRGSGAASCRAPSSTRPALASRSRASGAAALLTARAFCTKT